jgi:hypothetical protein
MRCVVCACPCHACTDPPEPPHHTEPQPTTASHRDRPQLPQHTTHNTPNYNRLRRWSRDTAHGPRHAVSPDAAVTSMFLGAARPHQCPLHQPGPLHTGQVATAPHTHAPARPTPCKCRRCPTPIPVPCSPDVTAGPQHKATTEHRPAAPTLRLGGRTTGGEATFTRAAAVAALRPPPPRGAGQFTLLISTLI